jgi:O-methyltransferase involved in polyketide biosynthesis
VRWYDLDLPEVIAFRRQFLDETERMRFVAGSVLDFAWLDQLPIEPGNRFLFLAEGLFMYLPPEGVRSLVMTLCARFPGAELVAEVANRRIVRMMQSRLGRGKFRREFGLSGDVVYQFGIENSREMESWASGIAFLDDWTYFDEPEPKLGWMRLFASWPLFRWAQWTVHYRLGASPGACPP